MVRTLAGMHWQFDRRGNVYPKGRFSRGRPNSITKVLRWRRLHRLCRRSTYRTPSENWNNSGKLADGWESSRAASQTINTTTRHEPLVLVVALFDKNGERGGGLQVAKGRAYGAPSTKTSKVGRRLRRGGCWEGRARPPL